jgi:hypothetical protein
VPETIASGVGALQGWLFQSLVLPVLASLGALRYTEDAFNGTEEFVLGALELLVIIDEYRLRKNSEGGASRDVHLQGVIIEVDDATGKARSIKRVQEKLAEE